MQRYALVTGLSNEEPAIIELLHEGPQRPLGVGLNLPKHGRNYPYNADQEGFYFTGRIHNPSLGNTEYDLDIDNFQISSIRPI